MMLWLQYSVFFSAALVSKQKTGGRFYVRKLATGRK